MKVCCFLHKISAYAWAKTQAEKSVYSFVDQLPPTKKFRVLSILPGLVVGNGCHNNAWLRSFIGPQLTSYEVGLSNSAVVTIIDGNNYPKMSFLELCRTIYSSTPHWTSICWCKRRSKVIYFSSFIFNITT